MAQAATGSARFALALVLVTTSAALGAIAVFARIVYPLLTDPRPHAVAPPTISGAAHVGATLRAGEGRWTGEHGVGKISLSLEWQQCDAALQVCLGSTHGEGNSTYAVRRDDRGYRIRLKVTGTNDAGDGTAYSAATSPVKG